MLINFHTLSVFSETWAIGKSELHGLFLLKKRTESRHSDKNSEQGTKPAILNKAFLGNPNHVIFENFYNPLGNRRTSLKLTLNPTCCTNPLSACICWSFCFFNFLNSNSSLYSGNSRYVIGILSSSCSWFKIKMRNILYFRNIITSKTYIP